MKKVLVLGAGGQIARWVIEMLATRDDVKLTLFLRHTSKLGKPPKTSHVVQGDVLHKEELSPPMAGQDIIYANLTGGDIDLQAKAIVEAMNAAKAKRLIFVASLGIYDEVPGKFGEWNRRHIGTYLPPFRRAADAIEASELDYTILWPAWLTDEDEIDHETTERNEPFRGTEVSRKSVADLIVKLIDSPKRSVRGNLGVDKPNTEGDKPTFM